MLLRIAVVLLCLCSPLYALTSARAQATEAPGPNLSDRGRTLLAGAIGAGFSSDEPSAYRGYYRWWVSVEPSVTYFVRNKVGIGVYLGGGTGRRSDRDDTTASVGLQGLFDAALAERTSFYFMPSLGYRHERSKFRFDTSSGTQSVGYRRGTFATTLFTPIVFRPVPNLALGFGPQFSFDIFFGDDAALVYVSSGSVSSYRQGSRLRVSLGTFIGASF